MELTWFRTPSEDRPGTLNLCYNALDRHVVAGYADRVAVVDAGREVTVATLLEQVAALAGGLQAVGLAAGQAVEIQLDGAYDAVLVTLAAARLGAVTGDVVDPVLLVTDRDEPTTAPTRVLRGVAPADPPADPPADRTADLTWEVVVGAGRQQPAACADLAADAPAYVVAGRTVTVERGADDDSPVGLLLGALCSLAGGAVGGREGRPVEL